MTKKIKISKKAYDEFAKALESSPEPNDKLKALLEMAHDLDEVGAMSQETQAELVDWFTEQEMIDWVKFNALDGDDEW